MPSSRETPEPKPTQDVTATATEPATPSRSAPEPKREGLEASEPKATEKTGADEPKEEAPAKQAASPATKPGADATATDAPLTAAKATPTDKTTPRKSDASKSDASKSDAGKDAKSAAGEKAGKGGPNKGSYVGSMAPPSVTALALASRAPSSRGSASRGLRKANPARMARSTSEWAKRPTGRFILPAVVTVLLLGAAGTAGAYLVPQALESAPTPSVTPGFGQDAGVPATSASAAPLPSLSTGAGVITPPALPTGVPTATTPGAVTGARPADALAGWAQETGTRAGIPVVAVQAYGYAQLVAARRTPTCNLSWTTVAAIGKVESDHGSTGNSVLNTDGTVSPDIFGLQLNGEGGRQAIRDTDQGLLDKDTTWDRAVGPMQFIPQTWNELAVGNAVDADNDGISNPNDIDDAALATATYLCKGGRDMSKPDAWWEAILTYNAVRPYAQEVYRMANQYGQLSRG
ncbi:hypothetical protein GCM10010435_19700 [Winogradskya consettensis]